MAAASDALPGEPAAPPSNGRARWTLFVIAVVVVMAAGMAFARLVTARRVYVLERTYRLLDRVASQITARVEGSVGKATGAPTPDGPHAKPRLVTTPFPDGTDTPLVMMGADGKPQPIWINDVLGSVVFEQAHFADVCLVDAHGEVLLHVGPRAYTDPIRSLEPLAKTRADADAPSAHGPSAVLTEWFTGSSAVNATYDDAGDWVRGDRPMPLLHRRVPQVAFCRSIKLPVEIEAGALSVCGIRPEDAINTEVRRIPPVLIALLGMALAAIVVAGPFLKIAFLGPLDRLRDGDTRRVVLAAITGIGLVTFGAVVWHAQRRLTHVIDGRARSVAGRIEHALQYDLMRATRRLTLFDRLVRRMPDGADPAAVCDAAIGLRRPTIKNFIWARRDATIAALCVASDTTPGFVPRTVAKKPDDRQYFKDVRADHVWHLPWIAARRRLPAVTLDTIQTRSTGDVVVVVAMAHDASQRDLVAVATTPRGLFQPILPTDFGFAVIDDDGNVLLHSDMRRAKTENFFEESGNSTSLAALVRTRAGGSLDVAYYGTDTPRLYVHPLAGTPWSLVVFHQRAIATTAAAATVIAWAATFLVYLLAWAAALEITRAIGSDRRLRWIWPVANRSSAYGRITVGLLVLGVLARLACTSDRGPAIYPTGGLIVSAVALLHVTLGDGTSRLRWLAWLSFCSGVALVVAFMPMSTIWWLAVPAVVGLVLTMRSARHAIGRGFEGAALRPRYVTMMTVLLLEIAAWPSFVVFHDAWNGVTEALARQSQIGYAQAVFDRMAPRDAGRPRHWRRYDAGASGRREPDPSIALAAVPPRSRLERFVAEHACAMPRGTVPARTDHCRETMALAGRSLASFVLLATPAITPEAAILQGFLAQTHASDESWRSVRRGRELWLTMHPASPIERPLSLSTTLPPLGPPPTLLGWLETTALMLLVGAIAATAVRFIVMKLFAIGPTMPDRSLVARRHAAPTVWLFARLDGHTIDDLLGDPARRLLRYDLRTLPATTRIVPAPSGSVVVVDWLETRLGDAAWSARLLTDLESLVFDAADLVIVCGTDPVFFLADQVAALDDASPAAASVLDRFARWTRVLGACASVVRAIPWRDPRATPLRKLLAEHQPGEDVHTRDAWYWQLWAASTTREKLAMSQLAVEGFFNPKAHDVVRHLLDRGLLFRNPELAFFDPDFRDFVLRAETPTDVRAWEKAGVASGWSRLQRPLAIAIVAVLGVLVLVQPDVYTIALGVLTGFTTLFPKILDVLGQFGQKRPAQ